MSCYEELGTYIGYRCVCVCVYATESVRDLEAARD
jgi:hypothetical protein